MRKYLCGFVVVAVVSWLWLVGSAVLEGEDYHAATDGLAWVLLVVPVVWAFLVLGGWTIWRGPWVWPYTCAMLLLPLPAVPGWREGLVWLMLPVGVLTYGLARIQIRRGMNGERD